MSLFEKILFEGDTDIEHYQVVDLIYEGRPARLLFSGNRKAAQSGIPRDKKPEMLFDYNQRFVELAYGLKPSRILLIGGGAYTLPTALLPLLPHTEIDVIEIDPGLDGLAEHYFGYQPNERLRIIHTDGRHFLNKNTKPYDLLLVDAFSHATLPPSLATVQAVTHMRRNITNDGVVAMNIIASYRGHVSQALRQQYAAYQAVFDTVDLYPADNTYSDWLSQNFILTGRKGRHETLHYMRFEPKPPLDVRSSEVPVDNPVV